MNILQRLFSQFVVRNAVFLAQKWVLFLCLSVCLSVSLLSSVCVLKIFLKIEKPRKKRSINSGVLVGYREIRNTSCLSFVIVRSRHADDPTTVPYFTVKPRREPHCVLHIFMSCSCCCC